MYSNWQKILVVTLVVSTVFTRFVKLDWGNGYFFQPDENNMASAISQFTFNNLNPHFFAYGQFPLYLTFFSLNFFHRLHGFSLDTVTFSEAIYGLRFWSAFFSSFAVYVFYLVAKNLLANRRNSYLAVLLFIFNPGLIQLSHFGTTESLLILVFLLNLHFSLRYYRDRLFKWIIFSGIISGIGLGTKISAIILTGPFLITLLFIYIKRKKILSVLFSGLSFLVVTLFVSILTSPFSLIAYPDFISAMNYEMSVATGSMKVFYTNQFLNTTPYLFQLVHIFPYISGLPVFIFSLIGLLMVLIKLKSYRSSFRLSWLIILIPSLVYFLYTAQLYTKWTRFMSPLFFIFPLLAVLFISHIRSKILLFLFIFISILPGLNFLRLYLSPDIRLQASDWIEKHLPSDSNLFSEGGNVVNLPITSRTFRVSNFDFYNLDSSVALQQELPSDVYHSDYILIPSRRIFKNQNNNIFPFSQKYYQALFSSRLGFSLINSFKPAADLLLNPENAEETWSVFDHPTIRIYQKTNPKNLAEYQKLL